MQKDHASYTHTDRHLSEYNEPTNDDQNANQQNVSAKPQQHTHNALHMQNHTNKRRIRRVVESTSVRCACVLRINCNVNNKNGKLKSCTERVKGKYMWRTDERKESIWNWWKLKTIGKETASWRDEMTGFLFSANCAIVNVVVQD